MDAEAEVIYLLYLIMIVIPGYAKVDSLIVQKCKRLPQ